MKARNVLVVPAALALALVTACGGGGAGNNGPKPTSPAQLPASSINAQPRSALQQGGELKIPIEEFGGQWNRMHVNGNLAETGNMMDGTLLPNLLQYNDKGEFSPNPTYLKKVSATTTVPTVATYDLTRMRSGTAAARSAWRTSSPPGRRAAGRTRSSSAPAPRATTRSRASRRAPTTTRSSSPTRVPTPTGRRSSPSCRRPRG